MGMGVGLGDSAMRRPNACGRCPTSPASPWARISLRAWILPTRTHGGEAAVALAHGDARRMVASVLEALEAIKQNGGRPPGPAYPTIPHIVGTSLISKYPAFEGASLYSTLWPRWKSSPSAIPSLERSATGSPVRNRHRPTPSASPAAQAAPFPPAASSQRTSKPRAEGAFPSGSGSPNPARICSSRCTSSRRRRGCPPARLFPACRCASAAPFARPPSATLRRREPRSRGRPG